jgi:prepilin peptidase CpaA
MSIPEFVALAVAGIACATDLRTSRIPNWLTFSAMAAGVLYHGLAPSGAGFPASGLGLLAGVFVFFPFFALGALGAGDVKLMAALGTWLGWLPVVYVALYGAIAGGVLAVIVSMWHGYLRKALSNLKALLMHWWVSGVRPLPELTLDGGTGLRLPYALPIMAGLVVTLWSR